MDRSILDSGVFVRIKVLGTEALLAAALKHKVDRFLQVSTDGVYGSLGEQGSFSEDDPLETCPAPTRLQRPAPTCSLWPSSRRTGFLY